MASFNSGFYGNGGFSFESSGYSRQRESRRPNDIMFDDKEFDEPTGRGKPQRPKSAPARRPIAAPSEDTPLYRGRALAEDPGEEYDDYRPGSMDGLGDFDDDFDDVDGDGSGFDDDFDDDFDAPPPRAERSAQAPHRLSYSRYDNDYSSDDYAAEFGGIRSIGSRTKKSPVRGPGGSNGYDNYEHNDADSYYGSATMRDQPYNGEPGVPRVFSQYFDDDYIDERLAAKNRRNKTSTSKQLKRRRALGIAMSALCICALAGGIISYFTLMRSTSPLNVATALTKMSSDVSNQLIKSLVDTALASHAFNVTYSDSNGQKKSGTFSLGACDFEYSTDPDGTEKIVETENANGATERQTIKTMGTVRFNESKVRDFLYKLVGSDGIEMIEPEYNVKLIQDRDTWEYTGTLEVTAGTNGFGIDYDSFIKRVIAQIAADDYSDIDNQLVTTVTPAIDVDKIHSQVYSEAADSYSITAADGSVTYADHIIGKDFDVASAKSKIAAGGTSWVFDLSLTVPAVTKQDLEAYTFPDVLATYSTQFNAGNKARVSNLALAGEYINGTILEPGEEFSYNDAVGERTPERGFSKATVYSSEGTDEDYGGGICQTSSTLYYTAIKANLKITARRNHLYTVAYMVDDKGNPCYGNDATVNWGTADLKFVNNKKYPIRLDCVVTEGTITFTIMGTWDGYTAEFRYVEESYEPFKVVYHKYQAGKKNQAGQRGRIIRSYRVVFYEGEEISREREHTSKYLPLNEVKYVSPGQLPAGCEYDVAY